MDKMIIEILRILVPSLKEMAAKSGNPIDDVLINILDKLLNPGD